MNNKKNKLPVLGIDIGRVIIGAADMHGKADTVFLDGDDTAAMNTPATPDAFEVITKLVDAFQGKVWLVSKCGPRIQARSRRWLKRHRFFEITGVRQDRLRFCHKRHEKRGHCVDIGATHFVDDRVDVLKHLREDVPNLFLFGTQKKEPPSWATHVAHWRAVEAQLLS
ncbi:MAG: hypothetical protein AB8H86_26685 [Polyangiales bacterium]